ncbi:Hypothetical protein DHA2_150031 [Giardia duodenalis]|uniref:Uncharacterized protein n=1 Tax=Giardia intestinalis TaxID=5741 RepID=V6TNZ2_GIAIN|nr:Hypothetical protein DHA2_150031 [Giardia intestinalis]
MKRCNRGRPKTSPLCEFLSISLLPAQVSNQRELRIIKMETLSLGMHWSHTSYADDCFLGTIDESLLSPKPALHQPLYALQGQEDSDQLLGVRNSSASHRIADGPIAQTHKKMSQHRLLLFLRFLDSFVSDFVSQANKIADYHNNLIFRRIRKDLFLSLREHFNYRMAPNPYSSDIVFTAFFLFNVLVQSVQKQNWNPITLPDHLTEIFSQRDSMKRLIVLCVKQYHEVGRTPKSKQLGVPPNRYYRCLQPFFKNDTFIVSLVHTIQDRITMAIQTVTRYIEQRKAQFSEQKRAISRRVVRKVSKENTRTSRDMSNTAKAGETDAPPSVSKNVRSTDVHSTSVGEFTPSGTQELSETSTRIEEGSYPFNASQDQVDQWLTDYLQHTNSGFYVGEDFNLDDPCFLPIN